MTDPSRTVNPKVYLEAAERVIDALPWRNGTQEHRKLARGRSAALANQVTTLLAAGWTVHEVRAALAEAPGVRQAPDPAAQERLWRGALKRAKNARDRRERLAGGPPGHDPGMDR